MAKLRSKLFDESFSLFKRLAGPFDCEDVVDDDVDDEDEFGTVSDEEEDDGVDEEASEGDEELAFN